MTETGLHGLIAEFETPDGLVKACRKAHDAGYRRLDAYTPYPLEGVAEAIGFDKTQVPLLTLMGGLLGGLSGFLLQCWVHMQAYPLNIGGRPEFSWPSFIIVTFEMTVLFAGPPPAATATSSASRRPIPNFSWRRPSAFWRRPRRWTSRRWPNNAAD